MDLTTLLSAPAETLVPVGWIRQYLLPEPDPALVQLEVALEVASEYWAGVIRGQFRPPLARAGRLAHGESNGNHEHPHQMSRKPWRESFGQKGVSRVTIYNRPKASPFISIEWWENGRRRGRRLEVNGRPIPDGKPGRDVARRIARDTVDKLEGKAVADLCISLAGRPEAIPEEARRLLADLVSMPPVPPSPYSVGVAAAAATLNSGTVEELFDRWLEAQRNDRRLKAIAARQWKEALGGTTVLKTLTPAAVNERVRKLEKERQWSPKTTKNRVQHLRMALGFARSKLEWEAPNPDSVDVPEVGIPDTEELTYSPEEYDAILTTGYTVAEEGPTAIVAGDVDPELHPTAAQALLVVAAFAIAGTLARRLDQVLELRTAEVRETTLIGVEAFEFDFPRGTEKASAFKDSKKTVATINRVEHPLQYRILATLLRTRGVKTSGLLFPSVPNGKSLSDKLKSVRVDQDTMREYLRKLEPLAEVSSIPRRAFHGLKRFSATQCETMEELEHLAKVSNTDLESLLVYHKRLGTFINRDTRASEERKLKAALKRNAEGS